MRSKVDADVLIVGSGPAGCAAALEAVSAGLRTTLLELQSFPRSRAGESLHPGIEALLDRLAVGDLIRNAGYRRFPGIWVGWNAPLAFQPFGRDGSGEWRGFHAPGADFDLRLQHAALTRGVQLVNARAERPLVEAGRVVGVTTSVGGLRARYVVDASGHCQWLARHLRLPLRRDPRRMTAFFGYASGPRDCLREDPQIQADSAGWSWIAQIESGLYSWTRLCSGVPTQKLQPPAALARFRQVSRVRGADVTWRCLGQSAGPGYFIVGDAATVLDPASSHGVLRALMSGMFAAFLIHRTLKGATPAADAERHYSSWMWRWFRHDAANLASFYSRATRDNGYSSLPPDAALSAASRRYPPGSKSRELATGTLQVTVYRPLVGASDLKWHLSVVEWGRGGEYALGRGAAGQDRSAGRGTGQAGPRAGGQGPAHRGTRANHRGVGAAWEAASGPVLEGHAILGSEATRPQAG